MKKVARVKQRIAQDLGMPPEIASDIPRIILVGRQALMIESHQGIMEYRDGYLSVCTSVGRLCVTGEDLELEEMGDAQLVISGSIDALSFEMEGHAEDAEVVELP